MRFMSVLKTHEIHNGVYFLSRNMCFFKVYKHVKTFTDIEKNFFATKTKHRHVFHAFLKHEWNALNTLKCIFDVFLCVSKH